MAASGAKASATGSTVNVQEGFLDQRLSAPGKAKPKAQTPAKPRALERKTPRVVTIR